MPLYTECQSRVPKSSRPVRNGIPLPWPPGLCHALRAAPVRLSLDTRCHLWNRRFYDIVLHYQLLFLRKRPSRLYFRLFNASGSERLTLRVWRSDGVQPDVAIQLPAIFEGRLVARQTADDTWQFLARHEDFSASERVEGVIRLTDRRSGAQDHVRVIVEGDV